MAKTESGGSPKKDDIQKGGAGQRDGSAPNTDAQEGSETAPGAVSVGAAIVAVTDLRTKLREAREKVSDPEAIDRLLDVAETFLTVADCQSKTMTRVF